MFAGKPGTTAELTRVTAKSARGGREVVEDPFNLGIGAYLICDYWLEREVENPGLFPQPLRRTIAGTRQRGNRSCVGSVDFGMPTGAAAYWLVACGCWPQRLQTLHLFGIRGPRDLI